MKNELNEIRNKFKTEYNEMILSYSNKLDSSNIFNRKRTIYEFIDKIYSLDNNYNKNNTILFIPDELINDLKLAYSISDKKIKKIKEKYKKEAESITQSSLEKSEEEKDNDEKLLQQYEKENENYEKTYELLHEQLIEETKRKTEKDFNFERKCENSIY